MKHYTGRSLNETIEAIKCELIHAMQDSDSGKARFHIEETLKLLFGEDELKSTRDSLACVGYEPGVEH